MTIATFNIDWAKKNRNHIHAIEFELKARDFDILILTESVPLNLPAYNFIYATTSLPQGQEYEGLDYSTYLNGRAANRVTVYSKYPSLKAYEVVDDFTSICHEFDTDTGGITIYATIIGTWFRNKMEYAKKELDNCIQDCQKISKQTNTLCLAGDLNTSFLPTDGDLQINNETTMLLKNLCITCKLVLTTAQLENNIDHIFLPQHFNLTLHIAPPKVFVEKGKLSDHQGVYVDIQHR